MAVFAATNYQIFVNSVDMSAMCQSAELDIEVAELDATAFGTTGYMTKVGGLKSGTLTLTFNQDFATSQVDQLVTAAGIGNVVSFEVRPVNGTVTATNPKYTGNVLITGYSPVNAKVGDLAQVQVSWPTSGAITRGTS